jgi:hypothetical protein
LISIERIKLFEIVYFFSFRNDMEFSTKEQKSGRKSFEAELKIEKITFMSKYKDEIIFYFKSN